VPRISPRSGRPWVRATVLSAALLLSGVCHAAPDAAEPATATPDPVMKLLEDRGLLEPVRDSTLMRQVRDRASDLVLTAMNFIGVRYRLGGTSAETGFDCSGFTRHIFERSIGLLLPRRADEQANAPGLLRIDQNDLRPGDLVFFNTLRRTFSHVGIYIGDGKFIHSPRSGSSVRVEDMRMEYWQQRFNGARRAPVPQAVENNRVAP
jgi:NlpC/P60 family